MLAGSIALVAASCSDHDYNPGEEAFSDNPVYFNKSNPFSFELEENVTGNEIYLVVSRTKTDQAQTIPIEITYANEGLIIPESISFTAGQKDAELVIKRKETSVENTQMSFDIKIGGGMQNINPYEELDGTATFRGGVTYWGTWHEVADVTFTVDESKYSNGLQPLYPLLPFTSKLYTRANVWYRFENFLLNNAKPVPYDFTFTLAGTNIQPNPREGFFNENGASSSSTRWYFDIPGGSEGGEKGYRIRCNPPYEGQGKEGVEEDYIDYIYFYTGLTYSNYDFTLDLDKKTGGMWGYARFTDGSRHGRIKFDLSWK